MKMTRVVDFDKARTAAAARRGYRNWRSRFQGSFDTGTRAADLSDSTLAFLARGSEESAFYLYDLIMQVLHLGSGFEIRELKAADRMAVMDRYLFVLDRLRFEMMKRLDWLEGYPGEDVSLVDMTVQYEDIAPGLQARVPALSRMHPEHATFESVSAVEKESFIRKLIPGALEMFPRKS